METARAKLVVIDDIRSVVEMITKKIPWSEYGIEVVGKARDGEEGLAVISEVRPDIVLTDIRMPKLDGLDMTERIMQLLPDCKVIILSGYTDFEYARKAVRLGATDFIKKPFTVQEIVDVTLKAKALWLETVQKKVQLEQLNKQVKASLPVLRQEYLNMLLQFPATERKMLEQWRFLELDIPPNDLTILTVEIDEYQQKCSDQPVQEIELIRFSLQNILEETIREHTRGTLFRETSRQFLMMIHTSDKSQAMRIAEACCANIARFTKFTVSIGVGNAAHTITDLPNSYRQARAALSYHFYTGGNAVFHYDTVTEKPSSRPAYSFQLEESLVFALQSGNRDMVLETVHQLAAQLMKSEPYPEPEQAVGMFMVWAAVIYRTLLESLAAEQLVSIEERIRTIRTGSDLSIHRLTESLIELSEEGCRLVLNERQNESQKVIRKAVEYIQSHLGDELSVDRCAKVVNLSGGYFANLFKKEMGMTFNHFVTQERLERAKKMLIQNVPVQDIALDLGYGHRRYFSDVFKKHTGMTPSEFRNYYQNDS